MQKRQNKDCKTTNVSQEWRSVLVKNDNSYEKNPGTSRYQKRKNQKTTHAVFNTKKYCPSNSYNQTNL
jgi:hypothetical protein